MIDLTVLKKTIDGEETDAKPRGAKGMRILVVDDDDALRHAIGRTLQEAGYRVSEASTGAEAIARAAESPDLITLAVNLPDMDEFQVCQQLKSSPQTSHIPILHVPSMFSDPKSRVHGREGGVDAHLPEPMDRSELVAAVTALLRLNAAESEACRQAGVAEAARKELAQLNATLEDKIKERTSELSEANDSLRELSARLLQARDDDQRRVARELHDGVGQLVIAIKINNSAIAKQTKALSPFALQALRQNEAMLHDLHQGIRKISHLLHPPLLDEVGLPVALRWYVEEFSKRTGIKVELECPEALDRATSELETGIFRVVQECLGNIHQHSASPTAGVLLEVADGRARLEISDKGVGIPPNRQHESGTRGRIGTGLRGIHARLAQLGGEMQIDPGPQGTTIKAVIPWTPLSSSTAEIAD
jgi:signal transduction histidine kinase